MPRQSPRSLPEKGAFDAMTTPADPIVNAFIVGAPKCGTSSLHHLLKRHPQMDPARPKEPKFFGPNFDKGWDWYGAHFKDKSRAIHLDSSTMYSLGLKPFGKTPDLIAKHVPGARVVYMARDPVRRFISQYKHLAGRKAKPPTLDAMLDTKLGRTLVHTSMYAQRVEPFARFDLHVMQFERLVRDTQGEVDRLLAFFGLEPMESRKLPRKNVGTGDARKEVADPDLSSERVQALLAEIVEDARVFADRFGLDKSLWPSLG